MLVAQGTEGFDAYGSAESRTSCEYFGVITQNGYTVHLMIEGFGDACLIYRKARLHITKLGVFTSADPLFADMHHLGGRMRMPASTNL